VGILHWQVCRVEGTGVLDTDGRDQEEDDNTGNHVGDGKEWVDEWGGKVTGDNGPIEGDWDYTKTTESTEDLVDDDVLRSDPGSENEVAQELGNPSWEEIPNE
jgi:hypothetical protein